MKCFILHICLILLVAASIRADSDEDDDVCEPKMADECFQDVADDIRFIFDPANNFLQASNKSALRDLCSAWEDSLNCTAAIIDTMCNAKEGREQFDAWNDGLYHVVEYLCYDDMQNLQAIAASAHCWSFIKFIQCTESTAKINNVTALLNTPLFGEECDVLKNAVHACNVQATAVDCPESPVVLHTLKAMLSAFLYDIKCMVPHPQLMTSKETLSPHTSSGDRYSSSAIFLCFVVLVGIFTRD